MVIRTEVAMADENADKADVEAEGRKAAAGSLRRQIDDLIAGKTRPAQPSNLRDFIDRKMAEDKQKKESTE
jgi:hypothetical protein